MLYYGGDCKVNVDRVAHELQKVISYAISNELNDPRVKGIITITRVETSKELSVAKAFVSIMTPTEKERKECFEAISTAAGYIRTLIKPKLKIRNVPTLVFKLDDSIEYSMNINTILRDLK